MVPSLFHRHERRLRFITTVTKNCVGVRAPRRACLPKRGSRLTGNPVLKVFTLSMTRWEKLYSLNVAVLEMEGWPVRFCCQSADKEIPRPLTVFAS